MTAIPNQSKEDSLGPLAATGIKGLDDVLRGGLVRNRLYLVEGVPGSGKTTLALQFLLEGVRLGEKALHVTLSETATELRATAASHGWSLDGIHIHEVIAPQEATPSEEQYTIFHPADVELNETTQQIVDEIERTNPARVVFDSLSEVRLLAGTALRYRRQILALKRYLAGRQTTVLLLDDLTATERDLQVQSIAHGVILLDQATPGYGGERRRLRVVKYRGVGFRGGFHDFDIRRGGVEVYPRLVASEHRKAVVGAKMASGILEMDELLGGGIEQGTSTLIAGPPGTGKSSLAAQFVTNAAQNGSRAAMFIFDESVQTLLTRMASLGANLQKYVEDGTVTVRQVDPAELSPGELSEAIRRAVEVDRAAIVVLDSLNGYLNAMPDERFLNMHLHELLSYLRQLDVATVIVAAQHGLIGQNMSTPVEATYLADAVILLRYFEASGEVRQAISVIKKRGGEHERTIREYRLDRGAIRVGDPLRAFRGVLTGVPVYEGRSTTLMEQGSDDRR